MNNYLFIASYTFSLPIMRPLQKVIRKRGDNVVWFFDNPALSRFLRDDEQELRTEELMISIRAYVDGMHPFYDGRTSYRVMEAVDSMLAGEFGQFRPKPRNCIRKRKMRKMMKNRREQLKIE